MPIIAFFQLIKKNDIKLMGRQVKIRRTNTIVLIIGISVRLHIPVVTIMIIATRAITALMISCLINCFLVYVFISLFVGAEKTDILLRFVFDFDFLQHNNKLSVIICQY